MVRILQRWIRGLLGGLRYSPRKGDVRDPNFTRSKLNATEAALVVEVLSFGVYIEQTWFSCTAGLFGRTFLQLLLW
jgi:hypothetical protein